MRNRASLTAAAVIALLAPMVASAAPDTLWTRVYDPNGSGGTGFPKQVLADTSGCYVFGYYSRPQTDIVTVKYTNTAELAWAGHHPARAGNTTLAGAALHPSGGAVVCCTGLRESGPYQEFDLVRYRGDGTVEWQNTYLEDTFSLWAFAMAVDPGGNTLVTGTFSSYHGIDDDLLLQKVGPGGGVVWRQTWESEDTLDDEAGFVLAVDSVGSSYVGGLVRQTHRGVACLLKYSPSGQNQWTQYFPSPDTQTSEPVAVAVGPDGDVALLLEVEDNEGYPYMAVGVWNTTGALRWIREFHSPDGRPSNAVALAIDSSGFIYTTGQVSLGPTSNDVVTVKFTPDGDTVWTAWYAGEEYDSPRALAVGPGGSFYVSGTGKDSLDNQGAMMLCFDRHGGVLGKHLLLRGISSAVTVSPAGQVLAAAELRPSSGAPREIALIAYTLIGTAHDVGCTRIVAPAGRIDTGLVVTPVCSLASYSDIAESYPVRLRIGDGYNETAQITNHQPLTSIEVRFPDWTVGPPASYAVTCSTECASDPHPENDVRRTMVEVVAPGVGEAGTMSQFEFDAPRVAARGTVVRVAYRVARTSAVELSVLDAAGRVVSTLVRARLPAGRHEVTWNRKDTNGRPVGAGVHYLCLAVGGQRAVRKFVLVE